MAENGEVTRVRFDLWAVLGFIVLMGVVFGGYLFQTLASGRAERIAADQQIDLRVTKLETHYSYIIQGIADLKAGQKEVADSLAKHEMSTKELMKVKSWNAPELKQAK
jgi:hypothetical protein